MLGDNFLYFNRKQNHIIKEFNHNFDTIKL